jgi:cytosine/adenosine deaminase-related metal-dependent hydrolase
MSSAVTLLRARWVFPVDQPPIEGGVVELIGDSIAAVRSYRTDDRVTDLGDVALLPGLINAHTHLEFSDLQEPLGTPQMPFSDWIPLVIKCRRAQTGDGQIRAVQKGVQQSAAGGVSLLGEIATCDAAGAAPQAIHQVIFRELLGLSKERIEPLWQCALAHVSCKPNGQTLALSPHATYTVHPELLHRVCQLSGERDFPVAMHVAESLDEIELLQSGSGRLVEVLDSLNAFPRNVIARGSRPLTYLQSLSQAARALVIHGNYLAADEVAYLGERSDWMSVVYCPRTHAYFNAGNYPLAEMLAANVNVCLGTDSRASNPDLNLFEEMRFVTEQHPQVTPEGVLHLGTQAGADALGLGNRFGSISPGKSARLAVVQLQSITASDPHELLFAAGTTVAPVAALFRPSP